MSRILIVEDEKKIARFLELELTHEGYEVQTAGDGRSGLEQAQSWQPDLLILDLMLPELSGIEVCRRLRHDSDVPIIMLTARSAEEDCSTGLLAGADDYVSKPFSPKVLLARIESLLRRVYQPNNLIDIDGLLLDQQAQRVSYQKNEITLSSTEYKLLHFFMTHPEKVYSREQLLDFVWGNDIYVEDRTVDSYIRRLRKNLEKYRFDRYIQTVRGTGYRFSNHFGDEE